MASTLSSNDKLVHLNSRAKEQKSEAFEYPHFYTPTKLAKEAALHLQKRLERELPELTNNPKGRMFGILVVETNDGLGYLSAYSGELQPTLEKIAFLPPVYQLPKGDDFPEMAHINAMGKKIQAIEKSEAFLESKSDLKRVEEETAEHILKAKAEAKQAKVERRIKREKAQEKPEKEREELLIQLDKQGTHDRMELRRFIRAQKQRIESAREAVGKFEEKISELKTLRKGRSAELQAAIFQSYVFRNAKGETRDVQKIFLDFGVDVPPAGAGECAAPKLFQYAFQHGLKPIALAEFWWGVSPISIIREHGQFYPACKRKCAPILSFMMQGMKVKPNPLLVNQGVGKSLEKCYEDEHFVVVNKPAGLLSVPGKQIDDSVQSRMRQEYPDATGPMIVHRLDQDTSGLMIVTLNKEAHKLLQQQFLARKIHKTYIAVLDRAIDNTSGEIDLPLILDIDNRPMQMVHFEHGKPALTKYEVISKSAEKTLIQLKPITGRTHQLRVHCAHKLGLHAPMVGDNLYGSRSDRLYLHAQEIEFTHPFNLQKVNIQTNNPFSIK